LGDSGLYLMMCCDIRCAGILNPCCQTVVGRCAHHSGERTLCLNSISGAQIILSCFINVNE